MKMCGRGDARGLTPKVGSPRFETKGVEVRKIRGRAEGVETRVEARQGHQTREVRGTLLNGRLTIWTTCLSEYSLLEQRRT